MLDSAFENKVQQKMEELTLAPADTVWQKIENGLPQKKEPRPPVDFYAAFCNGYIGFNSVLDECRPAEQTPVPNTGNATENGLVKTAPENITATTPPAVGNPLTQPVPSATEGKNNAANTKSAVVAGVKALKINGDKQADVAAEDFTLAAGRKIVSIPALKQN